MKTHHPILTSLAAMMYISIMFPFQMEAVQTEDILLDSYGDWAEGDVRGVAIEEPGRLTPARTFTKSTGLSVATVWSGARTSQGDWIVGTGGKGQVWRVTKRGDAIQLTQFTEPDVYAVACGPKGEIYAAPSPGGKIFRLNSKGTFDPYFSTGETYVWDMKVSADGVLYAATGGQGKIFRITGKDAGELWFDADEPHIRRLWLDRKGALLAGSAGKGVLTRITDQNRGVVLLDSGRDEITALTEDKQGTLYVAAVNYPGSGGSADRPRSVRMPAPSEGAKGLGAENPTLAIRQAAVSSSAGSAKSPKATTDLYKIQGDLYPEKIRELKDDILSLSVEGTHVWAGSGSEGRLYQISMTNEFALVGQVDAEAVLGISSMEGGMGLLTNGPAAVWNGGAGVGGTYTTTVLDSKWFARWGALRIMGEGEWQVRTRSGNTSDPDKSWHPWSVLNGDRVASPSARYLQVEITLNRGVVEQMNLFYLPQNQPPRISTLRLLDAGVAYEPLQQPTPPPQPQTSDQLAKGAEGQGIPPMRYQPITAQGARAAAWQAQDPNEDRLEFSVAIRREGEDKWDMLETGLENPLFTWDASGWRDGTYRLRVIATDAPDNVQSDALKCEKVTEAFTIDHTRPQLEVRRTMPEFVEIEAFDATSLIGAAYVSYNGHDFVPLLPMDGIADSSRETFRAVLKPGKTLFLRVEDAQGNVAGWKSAGEAKP
jgi:hypothetical protein